MGLEKTEAFYEAKYKLAKDPWCYNNRAVELLRYEFIVRLIQAYNLKCDSILDVGCSRGHLSLLMNNIASVITMIDISDTAVKNAEKKFSELSNNQYTKYLFKREDISYSTLPDNHFDLIFLCDGINEWFNLDENRVRALKEAMRILKPGGHAILSDYQSHKNFQNYTNFILSCGLKIIAVEYIFDRFAYQFNSWFKLFENSILVEKIMQSRTIYRVLYGISRIFGKKGAKHIAVIIQKP